MTLDRRWRTPRGTHALSCAGAILLAAACGGANATMPAGDFTVRFEVTNSLIAPVTIAIDGEVFTILSSGDHIQVTTSSRKQYLTWTSAKPKGFDGTLIPDEIGEIRIAVSGIDRALEIRNVINDQPYITAGILNHTRTQTAIGVSDGVTVACAGILPAANDGGSGFVQIGYYRLLATTEVRAYRDPAHCTGPYSAWTYADLAGFEPNSGLLALALDASP